MSVVMLLSCCASTCAVLSTTLRAAAESGLVASACRALVKLLNDGLERAVGARLAIDLCSR